MLLWSPAAVAAATVDPGTGKSGGGGASAFAAMLFATTCSVRWAKKKKQPSAGLAVIRVRQQAHKRLGQDRGDTTSALDRMEFRTARLVLYVTLRDPIELRIVFRRQ